MSLILRKEQSFNGSSLKSLLPIVTLLLAAAFLFSLDSNSAIAASQVYTAKGTWRLDFTGNGTAGGSPITVSANMSGTFDGDTSHGLWLGTYVGKYSVFIVGFKGQDVGEIKGEYSANIDDSGVVSGDITAKFTGLLVGEMKLKMQGTESESGDLKGRLNGTIAVNEYVHEKRERDVSGAMNVPVSGEFEGKVQKPTQTESPTSTPTPSITQTPTPEQKPISSPMPAPAQSVGLDTNMIALILVIIAAAAIGVYAAKRKKIKPRVAHVTDCSIIV
jgi:hypothetical protein